MTFVNKVRYKTAAEREDVKLAVLEAMDECIEENILVDFFEQHREEVVEVSIYDYDEEKVRKTLVDEAVEEIVGKVVDEHLLTLRLQLHEHLRRRLLRQQTVQQGHQLRAGFLQQQGNVGGLHRQEQVPQSGVFLVVRQLTDLL